MILKYRVLFLKVETKKKCNVLINGQNLFYQSGKNALRTYDNVWKIMIGLQDHYVTGSLLDYSKAFIDYSNDIDEIYKNFEKCNPNEKYKILIVFDDMTADLLSNEKRNPIVIKIFIRGKKIKVSLVFSTQFYFAVLKIID